MIIKLSPYINRFTNEIQSNVSAAINESITTYDPYYNDLSCSRVKKYQTNLDSMIDILEIKTGQQLSEKQRDTIKQIIVAEDLNKVVQENRKRELGVNTTRMSTLQIRPDNLLMKSRNLQPYRPSRFTNPHPGGCGCKRKLLSSVSL